MDFTSKILVERTNVAQRAAVREAGNYVCLSMCVCVCLLVCGRMSYSPKLEENTGSPPIQ